MFVVVVVVLVRVFFFYHSNRKITNIEAMLENLPGLLRADHSRQDSKWLPSGIHTTSEEAAASAD